MPRVAEALAEHAANEADRTAARRAATRLRGGGTRVLPAAGALGEGRGRPSTAGAREAALSHAADRVETALAGLERPLGALPPGAGGRPGRGPLLVRRAGAAELVEWQPVLLRAGVSACPNRVAGPTSSSPCSCGRWRAFRRRARGPTPDARRSGRASSTCATRFSVRRSTTSARSPPRRVTGPLDHRRRQRQSRPRRPCRAASPARRDGHGRDLRALSGGKGANQAVAAARLGAEVRLVCAVGRDAFADDALPEEQGSRSTRSALAADGRRPILVDADGENQIVVAPGPMRSWARSSFGPSDAVLCQLEIPTGPS